MAYFGCVNKSSSPPTEIFKSEYLIEYQEKYGICNSRTYKKLSKNRLGNCIVGGFYYVSNNKIYADPFCLISLKPEDTIYVTSGSTIHYYLGSVVKNNITFYYSNNEYFYENASISSYPQNSITLINTLENPFDSYIDGVNALLESALTGYGQVYTGYLHEWDLTDSLTDKITGQIIDVSNANYIDGVGIKIDSNNKYFDVLINESILNKVIEIDISDMSLQYNYAYDGYLVSTVDSGYTYAYYYTHDIKKWKGKGTNYYDPELLTDSDAYKNSTLKYIVDFKKTGSSSWNTGIHTYKDNILSYKNTNEGLSDIKTQTNLFRIGQIQKAYYDVVITGIRIYDFDITNQL